MLSGDGDDTPSRQTEATSVSSGAPAPANTRWTGGAAAQPRRRGAAEKASARRIAPRLAESKRLDADTDPLSPAQVWLQDFLMKFLRNQLRAELKRRGHSPTGLKDQLARRLVRDSSASEDTIWQLAAMMHSGAGRNSFPLAVLATEQTLSQYLREAATDGEAAE